MLFRSRFVSATVATRLLQIHLCAACLMMALGKLFSEVWWDGSAVWWLIAKPESRLVDLTWLAGAPFVFNAWTHAIVASQLTFPVLVWIRLARPLVLVTSALAWLSLVPITGQAAFALTMIVANLVFVRPGTMRKLISCRGCGPAIA